MTFCTEEALISLDQCAKDYLVPFQSWNITGTVIRILLNFLFFEMKQVLAVSQVLNSVFL